MQEALESSMIHDLVDHAKRLEHHHFKLSLWMAGVILLIVETLTFLHPLTLEITFLLRFPAHRGIWKTTTRKAKGRILDHAIRRWKDTDTVFSISLFSENGAGLANHFWVIIPLDSVEGKGEEANQT